MLWFLFLILNLELVLTRFEILERNGKYPTIISTKHGLARSRNLQLEDTREDKDDREKKEDFIKTLQTMVSADIVRQHSKALKNSKYRKLETREEDPFVWKFFIRPGDLEQLLNKKSRKKYFSTRSRLSTSSV